MILNPYTNRPQPPSEIVNRLKQIDDRLDLYFCGEPAPSSKGSTGQAHWAFILRWQENDPRWQFVRRGELPEEGAFDRLGALPLDCSVHEAFGYFEQSVRRNDKGDLDRLRSRINEWNNTQFDRNVAPVKEYAEELIGASHGAIGPSGEVTVPQFAQTGIGESPLTKKIQDTAAKAAAKVKEKKTA